MQLVLDTNVWIDWLVFGDPSIALLKAAQRDGSIHIAINAACLGELSAVLDYPEFGLDETQKKNHLAEVDRCTVRHDDRRAACSTALPLCTDPDDQKFLMLSQDAEADWLLTRDKALLRLNLRLKSAGIRVGSPAQWSVAFTSSG
jgi:uncharacterized protein